MFEDYSTLQTLPENLRRRIFLGLTAFLVLARDGFRLMIAAQHSLPEKRRWSFCGRDWGKWWFGVPAVSVWSEENE
jgi:hypothetical protein